MSILGYVYGGLTGIGVSYIIYYIIYLIGIKLITNAKYHFAFSKEFYKVLLVCIILCFTAFIATYFENLYLKNTLMFVIIISSSIFSLYKLDKKTDLIESVRQKFNRK